MADDKKLKGEQTYESKLGPIPLDNFGNDYEPGDNVDPNDPLMKHMAERMKRILAEKNKP